MNGVHKVMEIEDGYIIAGAGSNHTVVRIDFWGNIIWQTSGPSDVNDMTLIENYADDFP